jgi:hypothetical protein
MRRIIFMLALVAAAVSCGPTPPCGGPIRHDPDDITGGYRVYGKVYVDDVARADLMGEVYVDLTDDGGMKAAFVPYSEAIQFRLPTGNEADSGYGLAMAAVEQTDSEGGYAVGWTGATRVKMAGAVEYSVVEARMTGTIIAKKSAATRCSPVVEGPDKYHLATMTITMTVPDKGDVRIEIASR